MKLPGLLQTHRFDLRGPVALGSYSRSELDPTRTALTTLALVLGSLFRRATHVCVYDRHTSHHRYTRCSPPHWNSDGSYARLTRDESRGRA